MPARTPVVGVTTYYDHARWGVWDRPAAALPAPFFELVGRAGGRPVLLPPLREAPDGPEQGAEAAVGVLDALVLAGGEDLDPAAYGAAPHPAAGRPDDDRDRSERALLAAALDRDIPVLAICRGVQVLNVHLGGTLHQHVPDLVGDERHQPAPGAFCDVPILTAPGTITAAVFGPRVLGRCSHHQAVDRLGAGLVPTAWERGWPEAGPDGGGGAVNGGGAVDGEGEVGSGNRHITGAPGMVEAVELVGRSWVLGVQWHPEEAGDVRPFAALLAAADQAASAR